MKKLLIIPVLHLLFLLNAKAQINVTTTNASDCNKLDGKGTVTVTTTATGFVFEYSVDGGAYQTSKDFTNLKAGKHTATVRDKNTQCFFSKEFTVGPATCGTVDVLFLIDDTGSMGEEIGSVRDALTAYLATYTVSNGTVFQLVTFKDDVTARAPTTDLSVIRSQVAALFASGGDDCPEGSAEAFDAVKYNVKAGGLIFFATDASPHAGTDIAGITAAIKARGVRISTILSGDCSTSSLRTSQSQTPSEGEIPYSSNNDSSGRQAAPPSTTVLGPVSSRTLPANPNAIQAFSYMSGETSGVFAFVSEVNTSLPADLTRYKNIAYNIIVGGVTLACTDLQPRKAPVNSVIAFTLSGANTHFNSNTNLVFSNPNIEIKDLTVVSPTQIIGTLKINPGVTLGFKDVTATSTQGGGATEIAKGVGVVEIVSAPTTPTILSISPATGTEGENLTVKITGINTNFAGNSVINLGAGITVLSVTALNTQELLANIQISPTANIGFRNVTVTTGAQVATENVVGPFLVVAFAGTNYYSKSSGSLSDLSTWGSNTDGSGTAPTDFGSDKTFNLSNRGNTYTLTNGWTVDGTINIPAGSQLQLNGFTLTESGLTGGGTLTGSATSNLVVTGSGSGDAGILNFTATGNTLNNLTINRPGTLATATLGSLLNLSGVLTVTSGTFNTGNVLTLRSTAVSTARVAPVAGSISGDVTVERYIPSRGAWRILSAPVGSITTGAAVGQASLTHSQEPGATPLTTSTGAARPLSYGTATFSLNAAQTAMTMTATVYNIDVTGSQTPDANDNLLNAHIHVGAALGSNAAVRWGFFGSPDNDINPKQLVVTPFVGGVGGTFTSTWDLPEGNAGTTLTTNLPGILAGLSYINFHTTQFTGGEIRGQIAMVGAGTQTVNQAWQEGAILGSSAVPNPFPGYGTHITGGPIYGAIANGFDQNPVPGAGSSIKRYNGIINNWEDLPNTNATYVSSDAFMTFIRGDRGIPLSYNNVPPTATTLRAKGPLKVGDQVFQVSGNGFTGIPNPFASPVNFATITRSGVQNNFYVWDPKMGGDYGVGAYVLLSDNGLGGYAITPAPVSPESQYIQSGQGFLVRPAVAGTAGSITIRESDKSATASADVFRTSGPVMNTPRFVDPNSGQGWRITLKGMPAAASSAPALDEVLVSYHSIYKAALDDLDAVKMENVQENLGMVRDGQVLMVERKPLPQESDVIALKLWNTKPQAYLLEINPVNLASTGLSAWLEDKYLKTSTPVTLAEGLQASFAVGTDPASARTDRFRLIIGKGLPDALTVDKSNILAYPNPLNGRELTLAFANKAQGAYLVTVINASGQTILHKSMQHPGGTVSHTVQLPAHLAKGVYRVRVSSNEGETSFSITCN